MSANGKETWLVVGDGGGAQCYSVHAIPMRLTKVVGGEFKATPKMTSGPEHNSPTLHTAHVPRGHGDHQRHEDVFIENIAAMLEDAARAGEFDDIVVVLPPKALAHFRKVVSPVVQSRIKHEISGEWMHLKVPDLERHLAAELP